MPTGVLDAKVAIVTGAGQGIGEQVARRLAAAGAHVVLADMDERVEALADELGGVPCVGNLIADSEAPVNAARRTHGKLDIVVNNAGFVRDAPIHKITDENFQAMLDIHTVVPFRLLRAAAPLLRDPAKQDAAEGREVFRKVVNVTSLAGVMGNAGQVAYAAAKGGCIGLTRALAKEWGPLKINVNAVAFGFVETQMTAAVPEAAREAMKAQIPLGRGATPEEAARGVYFLCSPDSDYVHGQVLAVSGGLSVGMAG